VGNENLSLSSDWDVEVDVSDFVDGVDCASKLPHALVAIDEVEGLEHEDEDPFLTPSLGTDETVDPTELESNVSGSEKPSF
jgi:hypothetical protein